MQTRLRRKSIQSCCLAMNILLTLFVVQEVHNCLVHSGISHTLSQICQEFWIPQGRAEVRFVLSRCVICKQNDGVPFALPRMPPWPKERVSQNQYPFSMWAWTI